MLSSQFDATHLSLFLKIWVIQADFHTAGSMPESVFGMLSARGKIIVKQVYFTYPLSLFFNTYMW